MNKIKAIYRVFTTGQQVANPVLWKKSQITGGMVTGLIAALVALAKAFGYALPLTDDQLIQIGGAVVAVWGVLNGAATVASTTTLGLPAPAQPDGAVTLTSAQIVSAVHPEPVFYMPTPSGNAQRVARNGDSLLDAPRRE